MSMLVTTFHGHTHYVFCVAWSPNGQWLASGSRDTTAQVWEARTGRHLATFRGHDLQVMRIAWAPHGKLIDSCSFDDEKIRTWEAMTGEPDSVYTDPKCDDQCLAWSPDGQYLAAGGYHAGHVYHVTDHICIAQYSGGRGGPTAVAWSPDGRQLAFAGVDGDLYIRDFGTRRLLWRARAHTGITALAYSPDGQFLASSGYDATVQIRESSSGKLVTVYRGHPPGPRRQGQDPFSKRVLSYHAVVVWSMAWSPDSHYLASASGNTFRDFMKDPLPQYDTIHIWEAQTGRHIYTYMGHTHEVRGVAWSPDGTRIASASLDRTVQVWYVPV